MSTRDDEFEWTKTVHGFFLKWLKEPDLKNVERQARNCLRIPDDEPCEVSFFDEGALNKLYKIASPCLTKDYLLRVTPQLQPHYKTASEVANIRFIQQRTNIPVPIVVGYSSTNDNWLGFEWMIMEMLPGKPLRDVWRKLSFAQKQNLTTKVASYQVQLFDRVNRFCEAGSLYSSETPERPFKVGPIVDRAFIDGNHVSKKPKRRGPYKTASHMLTDLIQALKASWKEAAKQPNMDDGDKRDVQSGFDLVAKLTEMLPQLIPASEESIQETILWHWDLDVQNILLDEECNITGIIDWECCSFMPLWQAQSYPRFIDGCYRLEKPGKDGYGDAEPDDEDDNPPGFNNEGKNCIYWEHMDDWEKTMLRFIYDGYMQKQFPSWWWTKRKEQQRMLDLQDAIDRGTEVYYHGRINRWLREVKEGKDTTFSYIMYEEVHEPLDFSKPSEPEEVPQSEPLVVRESEWPCSSESGDESDEE